MNSPSPLAPVPGGAGSSFVDPADCGTCLRQILVRSLDTLRRVARTLARSSDEAEDLVQSTCQRALERSERLRDPRNVVGWLVCILRNIHIDRARLAAVRTVSLQEEKEISPFFEQMPLWRLFDDDDVARVLPSLPPELRRVWQLAYVEGRGHAEVARLLGIPRSTVATRMFRARATLRRRLEAEHVAFSQTLGSVEADRLLTVQDRSYGLAWRGPR